MVLGFTAENMRSEVYAEPLCVNSASSCSPDFIGTGLR